MHDCSKQGKGEKTMKHAVIRSFCALALALALLISCVPLGAADGASYMYVHTGNNGRLHLRALPTANSQSLGLYPNGTQVLVHWTSNGWAFVTVVYNQAQGYMATGCLRSGASPVCPDPAPVPTEYTVMYVRTGNAGKLHLRAYASQSAQSLGLFPNGTAVVVTARSNGWAYVTVNGLTGYMMLAYLSGSAVQPTPVPTVNPDPGGAVLMYVRTGNSGKLHLRAYPSQSAQSLGLFPNGTPVYARNLGNGWAEASVYGLRGYMMMQYLVSYAPAPTAAPTAAPAPTGQPLNQLRVVHTGNTGKLYLREGMNTDSAVLGKFENGTLVTVLYDLGSWSYVKVGGLFGYMMNCYLALPTQTVITTPSPTPVPSGGFIVGTNAVVRNENSAFVYLRSSKSSDSTQNVLAQVPNGANVTVLEKGAFWSRIVYNGIEGYMASRYLK